MNLVSGIINGLREIWAHKVRSILSMIGIILGVASLVSMVGVIQGMISSMWVRFEARGGIQRLEINSQSPPEHQQHIADLSPGRTLRDVEAIRAAVPLLEGVTAEYDIRWKPLWREGRQRWAPIYGCLPDTLLTENLKLGSGRFIADLDVEQMEQVIVVGSYITNNLFRGRDPVGKTLSFDGNVFRVIGTLEHQEHMENGRNILNRFNRVAYVPISTAMAFYSDSLEVSDIMVKVRDRAQIDSALPLIENTLRQTHRGIEDFRIDTRVNELQELEALERSFLFSLGSVAAISLIVGAIGIMNVMLASVNERIREIGVRKAVGARASDVFSQFIAEAFVISIIGGLIGIMLSVGLLDLLRSTLPDGENISAAPLDAMMVAFVFSVGLGVLSGIYPALRAARLSPIDALRHD